MTMSSSRNRKNEVPLTTLLSSVKFEAPVTASTPSQLTESKSGNWLQGSPCDTELTPSRFQQEAVVSPPSCMTIVEPVTPVQFTVAASNCGRTPPGTFAGA